MTDFTIGIWVTSDLDSNEQDDTAVIVENYLEKNIESDMGYTVDCTTESNHPDPPHEDMFSDAHWPANYAHPCKSTVPTFDDCLDWLETWHTCNGESLYDINLFCTNYSSTGGLTTGDTTNGFMCGAEASDVWRMGSETWSAKGDALKYSQMYATVLHEVGHAITKDGTNGCITGTWEEEYTAFTSTDSGASMNYTSPMVTWQDNNECCMPPMEYNTQYGKGYTRPYSECVDNHVRPMDNNTL